MLLCKNVFMRTTLDLPDPLFNHLKTRAAQEGRSLRDLVIELVEKGLTARETVNVQQRFQARPVVDASATMPSSAETLTNDKLFELINRDDDERAEHILQSR
jgi:plasmid stability protein